ncbi:MAG: accessory regulator [Clostridiaceae bacterium]|jgi:accessory gene regulator B|nr:accessory regulator [Clostridiaceae bacterium]
MIKYLSDNITDFFYSNNILEEEDKEIYVYGLHLIISTVIGITLIFILGLILNRLIYSIVFLISFIPIRMYSGGYHASSYVKCNLILIVLYLTTMSVVVFTPSVYVIGISAIMTIATVYIILKFAPVDNEKKRLTENKKKRNKKITLFILFTFYLIGVVMYKINIQIFYTIIVTMFLVSILIIKIKGGVTNEGH